ncbi:hypothetical protein ACFL6N_06100 [Thermodesulfobacteriota bacterium]
MNISEEFIKKAIRKYFPSSTEQAQIDKVFLDMRNKSELLKLCKGNEIDINRLQAAIIKLSKGKLSELKETVSGAYEDPLDIVLWAEEPNLYKASLERSKPPSGQEKEQFEEKDKKQYSEWLDSL